MNQVFQKYSGVTIIGCLLIMMFAGIPAAGEHLPPNDTALRFNGSNDYIALGDLRGLLEDDKATVSLWVKMEKAVPDDKFRTGLMRLSNSDTLSHYPWLDGKVYLNTFRNKRAEAITLAENVDREKWHLITITSEPGDDGWKFYQNDELVHTTDGEEALSIGSESFLAADDVREHDYFFAGLMADVRLYDRVLSASEIAGRVDGEDVTGGLVAHWPLDEGSGKVVKDMTDGKKARIQGDTEWVLLRPFESGLKQDVVKLAGENTLTLGPVELRKPTGTVSYQWYFNGEPIEGETDNSLTIEQLDHSAMGGYYVKADDDRQATPVVSRTVELTMADWPMWRYDAERSADVPEQAPEELHLQWMRELPKPMPAWTSQRDNRGRLDFDRSYSPVASEGMIFVPGNTTDSVTAYRIENGQEVWRFFADGPVRLAPAVWEGKIYFVADDGFIYCLDAKDGELLWKFRGAPAERRLLGNKRIISMWPARGGPVVDDGTVYFAAGLWPSHGIFVYALDAENGDIQWLNDTTGSEYVKVEEGEYGYGGLAPQGYLAVADERLVVANGRGCPAYFNLDSGEVEDIGFRPDSGRGYAVHGIDGGGAGYRENEMLNKRLESVKNRIEGEVFTELTAEGRFFAVTEDGRLYCFGAEEPETVNRYRRQRQEWNEADDEYAELVGDLIDSHGESEGYALILGGESEGLLSALLQQSEMHVLVVEESAEKVSKLREKLVRTGFHGRRAAVIEAEPADFSVQPYLFGLIMSEDVQTTGLTDAGIKDILESLRPYGGVAWFGGEAEAIEKISTAVDETGVDQVSLEKAGDALLAERGGPLTGAGEWSHQYQDTANTIRSHEQRIDLPLGVLWFGGFNNHDMLPQNSGAPRPQVAGGRQVYLGMNSVIARCVYTGRKLWEKEFHGIGRHFTDLLLEERWRQGRQVNMPAKPGATYIGSPLVTRADGIYVRHQKEIYRLDPETGRTLARFPVPGRWSAEVNDYAQAEDWGYIGVRGDFIITTSEPHIFRGQHLGGRGSYSGTSSRRTVVMHRDTGEVIWTIRAESGFRHNAIAASDETLYVVDGLSKGGRRFLRRRGEDIADSAVLLALDLAGGEEKWRIEEGVFGTFLSYDQATGLLLEGGNHDSIRRLNDEPRRLVVRKGSNGEVVWVKDRFFMPGVVRQGVLIPGRPGLMVDVSDGEAVEEGGRSLSYRRGKGAAGSLNAGDSLLLFNNGYAGFYDLEHHSGTGDFSGFSSGTTPNLIPADGVVSALDYTRTSETAYPLQTSLALLPVRGEEDVYVGNWTRYAAEPDHSKGFGFNFGAPGNRADVAGTGRLWYEREGDIRRHPSAITDEGESLPWVLASAVEGEKKIEVTGLPAGEYEVRFHFAELDESLANGERVFDVMINGQTVISRFDILESAGEAFTGVVREVVVTTGGSDVSLEFKLSSADSAPPLVNGVEFESTSVSGDNK